jgi:saccharopine dehydrogenase (NAD+, L-lysine forming)
MTMKNKIMIVGGYGTVGRIISAKLCALYPNQVIIAGRRFDKSQVLASKLNNKAIPYKLDICDWKDEEIMQQVRLVVMCVDIPSTDFVKYCIGQGIHYIDITPTSGLTEQIEKLDIEAKENHVSIVLSVGIAASRIC